MKKRRIQLRKWTKKRYMILSIIGAIIMLGACILYFIQLFAYKQSFFYAFGYAVIPYLIGLGIHQIAIRLDKRNK